MSAAQVVKSALGLGALALALAVPWLLPSSKPQPRAAAKPVDAAAPVASAPAAAPRTTLSIHMHFRDKYVWDPDWPVAREVERLTGVHLESVASKVATNSREQFNLILASGKLPDIVGGDNLRDAFIRYGMEGAFLPLNELIDRHAPHLKAFFEANPDIRRIISAPDGNLYYIPYVPDGEVARGWWIRQDWLDKLGLKTPQTVHELEAVLRAFRDRDPNGNGRRDEVPYFNVMPSEVYRLVLLWGARSSGSNAAMDFMLQDGEVVHPFALPAFRDGIRHVARWYAEGLIDREIFTRKTRAREQLLGTDRGGVTHDWFPSTSTYNQPTSVAARVPGFQLVVMPPPADPQGRRLEEDSRRRVMPDGWALSHRNRDPVRSIQLFDFFFSPAGRRLSNFGVEGLHHDLVNGQPVFKPRILKSGKSVNSQLWDVGAQIPIGFHQDRRYEEQAMHASGRIGTEMYLREGYVIPQFPGVNLTREERAVYDKYWTPLATYMEEMAQNWVLGTKDVDKTWDEYQRYLRRNGLPEVLAVMTQAYKRQYGTP